MSQCSIVRVTFVGSPVEFLVPVGFGSVIVTVQTKLAYGHEPTPLAADEPRHFNLRRPSGACHSQTSAARSEFGPELEARQH